MKYISIMCFALVYAMVLNIVYFKKNHLQTNETKYYSLLLIVNFLGLLCEIICNIVGYATPINSFATNFVSKIFMSFLTLFALFFSLYIYSICLINNEKLFKTIKKITSIVGVISVLLILILPVQTVKTNAVGLANDFTYLIGTLLVSVSVVFLIRFIKLVNIKKIIPVLCFIIFTIIIVYIQKNNPQIALTTSMETLVLFIMYFTIENPDLKMIAEVNKARNLSEQASNEKSSFLNVVTEDIKDKLNKVDVISGNILKASKNAEVKKQVSLLNKIVLEARDNIRKTIDVSSLDSKYIKSVENKYNVKLLLDSIYLNNKSKVSDGVEFRYTLNEGLPKELYGDNMKIKQILNTILDNSIKYTSKGFIEMRVNSIIKYDVCRLIIVIEDSGKGIDVLKHNEIMSNHADLTKSEVNNIDDSNLNLKVVKKMLNLIGGTFTIRSEEGMGTSVQVIIDQKIVPDEITSEEKSILKYNENLLKKKKIAVVSTNADSIKVIKSVNRRIKNDLFLFDVTKDLLDELRGGKHYDLVYIDENMDKIDARSFIYKIKVEQIACNVIVISSNKDFNNKKDLLDLGFKMVLFEPIKKDDVSESIKLIDNF